MKKFLTRWIPVLIWMGVIFYLSSVPNLKSNFAPELDLVLRKIAHVLEYTILTALFWRATREEFIHLSIKKILIYSFCFSFLYALSDEFHQLFITGRQGSLRDVAIDSIGILIALLAINKKSRQNDNSIAKYKKLQ